jgi:hypothetical protein
MDFEKRLEDAIARGQRRGSRQAQEAQQQALSEEELRRLHSQYRLELSEYIERGLKKLPDYFPGFRFESLAGDRGWGAAVSRDNVSFESVSRGRQSGNQFSRLEMTVRPFSPAHVLELTAKGTINNKEVYNRTQFHRLWEVELATFCELVDLWILEYAEQYAAKS